MLSGPLLLPKSGKIDHAVVLLHGYGDSGDGLIDIGHVWQETMPNTAFFAPHAPDRCEAWSQGYQWFAIRALDGGVTKAQERAETIKSPAQKLNAYIDTILKQHSLDESKLAVMGFSQGAMMAMYAMPRRAKPCAAVTAYSGMLVDAAGLKEQGIVKPPVLIVHGDADDVVPPFCLTDAARGLTDAGFSVETLMRAGLGHSIDSFSLQRGAAFILENL
jgi:phospholipase/carboxylesterase